MSNVLLSKSTWIFAAFAYTAQTGLNFRRYKKGQINKNEFVRRVKVGSVGAVGSVAGGSGGAAAGFAIGTVLFPGVGSIIGAVVGGIAGGIAGEKFSTKAFLSIEKKIDETKKKQKKNDKLKKAEKESSKECSVSDERYEEAVSMLGLHFEANGEDIEENYKLLMESITQMKEVDEQGEERQKEYMKKFEMINEAYEDAKTYIKLHKTNN